MRSHVSALGVLVAVALVATACRSESSAPDAPLAFCRAAAEFDHRLSTKADVPLRVQIRLVGDIVAAAPPRIAADARTFLEALERVGTDPSVIDDPDIQAAVENVNRYAAQGCDFYARQGGGI